MPRRGKTLDPSLTTIAANAGLPTMDTLHGKVSNLDDIFNPRSAPPHSGAGPKKRKRDEAADPHAAKRTSMPGASGNALDAHANGAHDAYPSGPSDPSLHNDTHDISSTAAAALTQHLADHANFEKQQASAGVAMAGDGSGSGAAAAHDTGIEGGNDVTADANMSALLGEDGDYSLTHSAGEGVSMPAADGDQQPYLNYKGEMSVERAEDGSVINVPPGMIMGRDGFPVRPPVGSDIWHKFRRDNHKEVERRRRETINEGINELAKIVPNCEKNKGSILSRAVQYIHDLQARDAAGDSRRSIEKSLLQQALEAQQKKSEELAGVAQELRAGAQDLREQLRAKEAENALLRKHLASAKSGAGAVDAAGLGESS